jgi:membrane protein
MKFLKLVRVFIKNFIDDDCFNHAASIAYFSVLSALPIVFLISNAVGFLTGLDTKIIKKVYTIVSQFVPNLNYETWVKLTGLFSKTSYNLNLLSLVILILSCTMIFSAIDKSLKDVFKEFITKEGSSLKRYFMYISSIFFLAFLVLLYLILDTLLVFLKNISHNESFLFLKHFLRYSKYVFQIIPVILQVFVVAYIFYFFIPIKLHLIKILVASIYTVLMWSVAVRVFAWYVNYIPTYNIIYGSMSIFIIFITWSFYSAVILLSGAELLKVMIKSNES